MSGKKRIGVLINTLFSEYAVEVLKGIERFCREHNCVEYIFPLARGKSSGLYDYHCDTLMNFINSYNIDGLVLCSATYASDYDLDSTLDRVKALPPIKKVSAGFQMENIPSIMVDSEYAVKKLVTHLIEEHGCRRFLLMRANSANFESNLREKYVREILAKHGIHLSEEHVLNGNFAFDFAVSSMTNYLRAHEEIDFDAVICFNDDMAMGCLQAFEDRNIKVPDDVIVTGFDNVYESFETERSITTIDQRMEEFSYTATELLYKSLNGEDIPELTKLNAIPVVRSSCGCSKERRSQLAKEELSKDPGLVSFERTELDTRHNLFRRSSTQLYLLHYFLMESQSPVPLDGLYDRLLYCLSLFDINGAMIVLYDHPVFYEKYSEFIHPESAHLVMTYTALDGVQRPDIKFNPRDYMIPPEIEATNNGTYTIFPLYAETYQYGYIVMQFGRYEMIFYQSVFELIEKEIINSVNITRAESEKNNLKNQNLSLEEYSEKLQRLSFTDEMTGLTNRRGFYDLAQKQISVTVENGGSGLVIYGDMDGLKSINDTFGHDAGDRAIKYEAQVLKSIFRSSDIIGRLGGDEFAIVAANMGRKDFNRVKTALERECTRINEKNLEPFVLSISIGFAEFSRKNSSLDALLTEADAEQYKEKRSKKERKAKK